MLAAHPVRVLALAPGAQHLGIAVLEGNELVKFGVKSFEGKKTERTLVPRVEEYLNQFLDGHQPTVLAVEDVYYVQARLSPLLWALTAAVKRWGRKKGLRVASYLPTTVKERLCEGKQTRRSLAEAMVRAYPFLASFLRRNYTKRAQEYWQQMFDAVALGTLAAKDAGEPSATGTRKP
jgi:Holliday junction resolvasome RuvABC endonuclease subunit